MKSKRMFTLSLVVVLLALLVGLARAQGPQPSGGIFAQTALGTAFTYQGQLKKDGNPVNDTCDFQFSLWDALSGGNQVGTTQTKTGVTVSNGLFTIRDLDFGDAAFWGDARWLQIAVKCTGDTSDTTLTPRQALTAAPYALGLRPGAVVQGGGSAVTGSVLTAWNTESSGTSVYGYAAATSGTTYGVRGLIQSTSGSGVFGSAVATSGPNRGVYGMSASTEGYGVYGQASATNGFNIGVRGESASTVGTGVYGIATAASGITVGVYGRSNSTTGGYGVYGLAFADSGTNYGVYGESYSTSGHGVYGLAFADSGTNYGVYGESYSTSGHGVYGYASAISGLNYGVYGRSDSTAGRGVYGWASATEGTNYGVYGRSDSTSGYGVYGYTYATSGTNYGVYGWSSSPDGYGGCFHGDVYVSGDLTVSGNKPFKIDHPLDPANRYLYHFAQEAPEVQNVYNGIVTLDAGGEAVVTLPDYFSALNAGPFRYQLTPIGAPMPDLHIAQEIQGNAFRIAGGVPGKKVSWEVTAGRNDPYMRDHPAQAEVEKPAEERGTYLYPEGYGQPKEKGLDYQRNAELFRQLPEAPAPQGNE